MFFYLYFFFYFFFFFNDTATTEIYTLSLHDALPISGRRTLDQGRQTQGLRHTGQDPVRRPTGPPDAGGGRLQETRSRFLAHAVRARRHAAPDGRSTERRAAPRTFRCEGHRDVRQERHGPLSSQRMDAGGGRRAAQKRNQALGRRDPRQQHFGPVVMPSC